MRSTAEVQQLVQCSWCSAAGAAAGASAAASAAQVQQPVHQQQQQLVQHKCCRCAAADIVQLVWQQLLMQQLVQVLHMESKSKCTTDG
jgi:hypothetical protein